jgi:L-ascorbate metabolism protein UlaG (beta-lactamase superfamily)
MARHDTVRSSDKVAKERAAMRVRRLGWAGVEIEADGASLVIDPLADAAATFAGLGDRAREMQIPDLVVPESAGATLAGLVTHLHRDHTDAGALAAALATGGGVYEPAWAGGSDAENLALAQANAELEAAGLARRSFQPWEGDRIGPFTITALPAVDGLGDPQVSWLVEAGGTRVLHLGDTVFHGYWWRMARRHGPFDLVLAPINGAAVDFPHLQPSSPLAAAMEPEQAAIAGDLLRSGMLVPIHYDGFGIDPWYRPVDDALKRFETAAAGRAYEVSVLDPGESLELAPAEMARPARAVR